MQKLSLEDTAVFIREHRSNEASFEKLVAKMETLAGEAAGKEQKLDMETVKARAEEYKKAREERPTAWPEFEKFVTEFERAINDALKEAA